ncbi:ABC transporter ATP-binding protein [Candidatus Haliotispira prima]|uniref:ABC transporter ATP-binding protein n=1 Tax=Candidatus Haliotispira prima TaxID=3034016 RepID=A0ABY8MFY5_9SPIO|nr:ABC transporter ATP-binding protein [Candidatus Haliotispira prima]
MSKVLEINELSKMYGRKPALSGISLSMDEGDIMGFIGPNGAGKTTTMNILMNFIRPSSGEAKIFGKSVVEESHTIKKELGFMASEDFLYRQDSGWKNLKYVADLKGMRGAKEKISRYAEMLDLDLNKKVSKLSKGNKRKVSLIAAVLGSPKILIMDEISVGLDPMVKARAFDLLKERNREGHCSIFFSSHILSEIEELCNRTAFIKQGVILKVNDVEAIGSINYLIRCENTENFARLENFLRQRNDIQNLKSAAPELRFQALDTKLTHALEEERLFCLMDDIQIRRTSLEQSFRTDYM